MIEDQPALRAGLTRLISMRFSDRIEVQSAGSAEVAIRQLALAPPELAILDVDLAGHDGLVLLPHFPRDCRVLVFTSQNDSGTRARAMKLGAAFFLEKGMPISVLLDHLSALLSTGMQGEHPLSNSGD